MSENSKFEIKYTSSFKTDLKSFKNDIVALNEIKSVIDDLANDKKLDAKFKDHSLIGNNKDKRECHIRPDLLLIYKKLDDLLVLVCIRVGSHAKLFKG